MIPDMPHTMKAHTMVLGTLAWCATALTLQSGYADDLKSAQPAASKEAAKPAVESKTEVTGSKIKQEFKRSGRITTTASPLVIIDRDMIERSGATDVKDLFRRHALGR